MSHGQSRQAAQGTQEAQAAEEARHLTRAGLISDTHGLLRLQALDAAGAGHRAVVSGHSHRPACTERDGVWYVDPGSAGPRRFTLPVAVGVPETDRGVVRPRLIELAA